VLSFIVVFGVTKALTNYLAGRLSDRFGRKHVLVGGWLVAAPVPFLLMWAPSWAWVLFANALLGVSQGLTWSTTVIMKIDLAGPQKRGLAMGLNEFAGYFAVAGSALATGWIAARYGLRPGALLPRRRLRRRRARALGAGGAGDEAPRRGESKLHGELPRRAQPTQREVFWRTTAAGRSRTSPASARRASSTTSTTAWRGACSRSSSPPPA
jgi:MFS family permease